MTNPDEALDPPKPYDDRRGISFHDETVVGLNLRRVADSVTVEGDRWALVAFVVSMFPLVAGFGLMWASSFDVLDGTGLDLVAFLVGLGGFVFSIPWASVVQEVAERRNLDACPNCGQTWDGERHV